MNAGLRITKSQLLFLVLFVILLLATALVFIHATMPALWHTITYSPFILNSQH